MPVYLDSILNTNRPGSTRKNATETETDTETSPKPVWRIARSMRINGEITAGVDVSIDGEFAGKIYLEHNKLSTGAASNVAAEIFAENVLIRGEVYGEITALDQITLAATAVVHGDISARRVKLIDGCAFNGKITTWPDVDH